MPQFPTLKTIVGTASRSRFHHGITGLRPVKRPTKRENRVDALGGLMIVCLLAGALLLMRLLLAN